MSRRSVRNLIFLFLSRPAGKDMPAMTKVCSFLLAGCLLMTPLSWAEEEISSAAQRTTQAVQTGEFSKTYELSGENLIALIEKMVDFPDPQTSIVFNRWT